MKRKNSKKSGIIAAVVGLSAVSLVSVGFASWIISAGDTKDVTGSIEADIVTDSRYLVKLYDGYIDNTETKIQFKDNIAFGSNKNTNDGWLKVSQTYVQENLTATAKFWVSNVSGAVQKEGNANILQITVGTSDVMEVIKMNALAIPDSTKATAFNKVVNGKRLFAALPTPSLALGATTKNDFGDGLTYYEVIATVTFGWGEYFNYQNPYDFYNSKTMTAHIDPEDQTSQTWGDNAKEVLGYVYAVNGASYTTTVKTGDQIS